MRVGIDFDHVLFNTEKFKQHLFDEIPGFDDTYQDAKDDQGLYSPEKHAEILNIPVERIYDAMCYADECLYPDMEKLDDVPERYELAIVSRGDPSFQSEKVEKSGILQHVDDLVLVKDRPKDEDTGIEFLVDDSEIEHRRVDLPEERKFLFDREKHGIEDVVKRIKEVEA